MKKLHLISLVGVLLVALVAAGCGKSTAPKLTPQQTQELSKQGNDLIQQGKFTEANKPLEQVAQSGQGDAQTYLNLGISRYQKKDYQGALAAYDKAAALNPKTAAAYQGKANVYRDQKNLAEADKWYRKAWATDPHFIDAYTELALQFSLAKRMPDAIAVMKEAIANNPTLIDLKLTLAQYYATDGQKPVAAFTYRQILAEDPNNKAAQQGLDEVTK